MTILLINKVAMGIKVTLYVRKIPRYGDKRLPSTL